MQQLLSNFKNNPLFRSNIHERKITRTRTCIKMWIWSTSKCAAQRDSGSSHDRGGSRRCRKIIRNIVARAVYKICPAIVFVSVFTFIDTNVVEPRDCHAFMRPPSCVVPYEYNILSPLDTSVDWKRYEYMSYVFVGRLSARVVETRREVQSLPMLSFDHTYLV